MIEALLFVACLYGQGCAETGNAYVAQPAVAAQIRHVEIRVEAEIGKDAATVAGTSALFLSGRQWTHKLTNNISLQGSDRCSKLSLIYTYSF